MARRPSPAAAIRARAGGARGVMLATLEVDSLADPVILAVTALACLAIGWVAASLRARLRRAEEFADSGARAAALEAERAALREQLASRDERLASLEADLRCEREARVAASTQAEERRLAAERQQKLLVEAEGRLKDVFASLSAEALRNNSESFAAQTAARVQPLSDTLRRFEEELKRVEQARQNAYGGVTEQLKQLFAAQQALARQTSSLEGALRRPEVKGRWGEITLQRAAEVAGMSPFCDFLAQAATDADNRMRPDMVVRLPGERSIVVDAKAPTNAYLDALDAKDATARERLLDEHADAVRRHMLSLSEKRYWSQFSNTPEFVVMFIPAESFFAAALERRRDLLEEGFERRVILASPTTLIAVLRTAAHAWGQQTALDNTRELNATAQELYDRVCNFVEHLQRMGKGMRQAVDGYNSALGSWERRLLPLAERIGRLGIRTREAKDVTLERIEESPRIPSRELLFPEAGEP